MAISVDAFVLKGILLMQTDVCRFIWDWNLLFKLLKYCG